MKELFLSFFIMCIHFTHKLVGKTSFAIHQPKKYLEWLKEKQIDAHANAVSVSLPVPTAVPTEYLETGLF